MKLAYTYLLLVKKLKNTKELILQEAVFNLNIDNTSIIFGNLSNGKVQISINFTYMEAKRYILQTSRHQKI